MSLFTISYLDYGLLTVAGFFYIFCYYFEFFLHVNVCFLLISDVSYFIRLHFALKLRTNLC